MIKNLFSKYKLLFVLSFMVFGGLFLQANSAEAIGWDAKPGALGTGVSWYGNNNACAAAQAGTQIAIRIDWQDIPASAQGYYVDFKRGYDFSDPTQHYIYNKFVASPTTYLDTDGNDLVDSIYDDGLNPYTKELRAGYLYYVRVYNVDNSTHYYLPGTAGLPECGPPTAPANQPSVSGTPSCAGGGGYTSGTVSWAGSRYDSRLGFYVDISSDNFVSVYNKAVPNQNTTLTGFNGSQNAAGPLTLQGGVIYKVRIFNGGNGHSVERQFSVSACPQPTCINTGPNNYTVPYGTNSHTMTVSTSNTTATHFAVTAPDGKVTWYPGVSGSGGNFSLNLDLSTYTQYGAFQVDIFMDNAYYSGVYTQGCPFHPHFTRESPKPATCTGAGPDNFVTYNDFGNHTIDVTGVHSSATAVNIAVYRPFQNPIWYLSSTGAVQNLGNGNWRLVIDLAAHIPANYSGTVNVDVWMNNPFQNNTGCDNATFQKQLRPATTAPTIVPSDANPCTNNPYTVTMSWSGDPRPTGATIYEGYYADAATVSNFSAHWNKLVPVGTTSTTAGTGFNPYIGVSGALTLMPGTNYYFRVFNDSYSPVTTYSRPRCGSLEVEAQIPGGSWILTNASGYVKVGTGTQSFNPTACAGNSYYCLPIGSYTLTPTPNTPTGYNGVVTPTTHNVN